MYHQKNFFSHQTRLFSDLTLSVLLTQKCSQEKQSNGQISAGNGDIPCREHTIGRNLQDRTSPESVRSQKYKFPPLSRQLG